MNEENLTGGRTMEHVIEVSNLTKSFGGKTVVNNLNLIVKQGETFGLLGHNGAGKSTSIDCILGLKKLDSGNVKVLGMDPKNHRKQLFRQVGVQLQSSHYQQNIKVYELCEEMSALYDNPRDYKELLAQFNLSEFKKQAVEKLSGGEKQKLSVLLTLIPNPNVLFLDELTTGLDTVARREVWKLLLNLKKQGVTLLLTSHYMDEVEMLCDRILILDHGNQMVTGTVADVIKQSPYDTLEEAYLWYMGEEVIA
jgi:ABC-2 type transport system ATP-binding protein